MPAIVDLLAKRNKERFMAELVEEARQAYADQQIRNEAIELAEEGADSIFDTIAADERAAGIDPNEKWWR